MFVLAFYCAQSFLVALSVLWFCSRRWTRIDLPPDGYVPLCHYRSNLWNCCKNPQGPCRRWRIVRKLVRASAKLKRLRLSAIHALVCVVIRWSLRRAAAASQFCREQPIIYGRRCRVLRALVRRSFDSFLFEWKLGSLVWFPERAKNDHTWENFRDTVCLRRLRPEYLGLVGGYADVMPCPPPMLADATGLKLRTVVGVEGWLLNLPVLGRSALEHELLHAAQQAWSNWIVDTGKENSCWKRLRMTWRAEFFALFVGSPVIGCAFLILLAFALYPLIALLVGSPAIVYTFLIVLIFFVYPLLVLLLR